MIIKHPKEKIEKQKKKKNNSLLVSEFIAINFCMFHAN